MLKIWTGAAGTSEWERPENWSEKIIPENGDSIRITMTNPKANQTPIAPRALIAADFHVTGNVGGGPIGVTGAFHWEAGHISADLELKSGGSISGERELKLSGQIKSVEDLAFRGNNQLLLDGGQVHCAKQVTFNDSGLRDISGKPSRFTSLKFHIKGSCRFSGRGLVVERTSDGLFYIEGELDVDEGAKLLWNKGAVGGMGFLNIIYDATMESQTSDSEGNGGGWWIITPEHTTAKFRLLD